MLPTSTVGRKLLMAVTGQAMILFVLLHVLGILTVFSHSLNAYAAELHAYPLLFWIFRIIMASALVLHLSFGIALTMENRDAKPETYAVQEYRSATFAGRNMIWTGTAIGSFLLFHLIHFTFQFIDPSTAAIAHTDTAGRPDVFSMVVAAFHRGWILTTYAAGLLALWLHLSHSIQSSFQTLGLNSEQSLPYVQRGGSTIALILLLAYAAIPAAIIVGILH